MKITKVSYYDIGNSNSKSFLAKCSIVLDDVVIVHDIRILNGCGGRYIVMPEKSKYKNSNSSNMNKKSDDVFHPVNQSYFSYMVDVILKGYKIFEKEGIKVYNPC